MTIATGREYRVPGLECALVGLECVRATLLGYRSSAAEDEPAAMYEDHMISVLSGGRKRRRRQHVFAPPLWLAAAAFASFVGATLMLVRI